MEPTLKGSKRRESMLTRKAYNALADIIREIPDKSIRSEVSAKMAGVLKQNNDRFDYTKWFNRCEPEEN